MRTIFMGTPEFSVPTLQALCDYPDTQVVAVFTQPDAVSKRGNRLVPSAAKEFALQQGLEVHTPQHLHDQQTVQLIQQLQPDVIVVVSYGNILPAHVLEIPRLGCINVHASLLPRWRGAAPIERCILADDSQTGVSIMRMEQGLDTGPYCAQATMSTGSLTAVELTAQLARLGAQLLVDTLPAIADGSATWTPQDAALATYAHKIEKDEMLLQPQFTVHQNALRVQASTEHAPARAVVCGRALAVLRATEVAGDDVPLDVPAGAVLWQRKRLLLGCSDGVLQVHEVKPDGKKAMDAAGFSNGVHDVLKSATATWEAIR